MNPESQEIFWNGLIAFMEEGLVPIFICCVMPIIIVWMVHKTRRKESEQKTNLLMKALENGQQIAPDLFVKKKKPRNFKKRIYTYLLISLVLIGLGGAICISSFSTSYFTSAMNGNAVENLSDSDPVGLFTSSMCLLCVGIAFMVYFLIVRKHFAKELDEEKSQDRPEA